VLYGYGSRKELETAGAAAIAATPEEVKKLILSSI
jgi:phosphoglycolate phosphatase-like HAD superfamily hydrolase